MHASVGAIIKDKNKILMMDRAKFPYGWAFPAGHVDKSEGPEQALTREIKEETNLTIKKCKLLFHQFLDWNKCVRGIVGHDWYLYEILEWQGRIKKQDQEAKQMKWINIKDIKKLELEEATKYWLKKLGII